MKPVRILFVCLGNICRSPMAEFILKDQVKKRGLETRFFIESAATSREELGNPVYPPALRELAARGIPTQPRRARVLEPEDYHRFDLLLAMDAQNLREIRRICMGDPQEKARLLLSFTERAESVADPWYTGDFVRTADDLERGCRALIDALAPGMNKGS